MCANACAWLNWRANPTKRFDVRISIASFRLQFVTFQYGSSGNADSILCLYSCMYFPIGPLLAKIVIPCVWYWPATEWSTADVGALEGDLSFYGEYILGLNIPCQRHSVPVPVPSNRVDNSMGEEDNKPIFTRSIQKPKMQAIWTQSYITESYCLWNAACFMSITIFCKLNVEQHETVLSRMCR